MKNIYVRGSHLLKLWLLACALGGLGACVSAPRSDEDVGSQQSAVTLSQSNLDLQESGNSCWANGSQTYFRVKNGNASAVKLSDITVKYWVNDTTGSPVVPHVAYGGCVTNASGTCIHPVSNVTASASQFAACGPDAQHQANWEITVSTTDTTTIAPGFTWSNLQTSINLASFANFSPGSSTWYSPCGTNQPFHADANYAVYVKGELVTNLGITPPDCRAPHGSQPIASYPMPPTSTRVGSLPKDKSLTVALSLPLRNSAALKAQVDAASEPASPTYRQWLTPAQLEATYLPTASDFALLTSWATSKGLQVSSQPSHRVAGLKGTVAQLEKALFVNMITAQRPDGTVFYAPDRRPTLELSLPVQGISSIDNFAPVTVAAGGGRAPAVGGVFGSFQSNDFRDAYLGQAPSTCAALTGTGQSIGILAYGAGVNQTDIDNYANNTGLVGLLKPTVVVAGTPNGVTPTPLSADDYYYSIEVSLDVEMALAMAPGAQVVLFEGTDYNLITDAMANSSAVAQFSSSFSPTAISDFQGAQDAHTLIAAQGHAFFQSSGDAGAYAKVSVPKPPGVAACDPQLPTASRGLLYNTLVGGTNLTLTAGLVNSESSWSGSGGGVLPSVAMPSYQANANPANPGLSAVSRNAPDVAMPGTNVYMVSSGCDGQTFLPPIGSEVAPGFCTGNLNCSAATGAPPKQVYLGCKPAGVTNRLPDIVGGTSAASPLWAAFLALANQARTTPGLIGFPNPAIYAIGKDPTKYAASFRDIQDGSQAAMACDTTINTAVAGYDQVTGWGSPKCAFISTINNTVVKRALKVDGAISDLVDLEGGSAHLGAQPISFTLPLNQATPTGSQTVSSCLNDVLGSRVAVTAQLSAVDSETIHVCVSEGLRRTSSAIVLTRLYGNPDGNLFARVQAGLGVQVFHQFSSPCGPSACNPFFFPLDGANGMAGSTFPDITPPASGIASFNIAVEHGAGGTRLIEAQGTYNFFTKQISGFDPSGAFYQQQPDPSEYCGHDSATGATLCWKFNTSFDPTACTGSITLNPPQCWDLPAGGSQAVTDAGLLSAPGAAVGTYGVLLSNIQDPNP